MAGARPLYDNLADAGLYVRPAAWEVTWRAVERDLNVMVLGARGSGKTSLLRQLQFARREADQPTAFVDATAVDDVRDLAYRIRDSLSGQPPPFVSSANLVTESLRRVEQPIAGASRELAAILREIGAAPPSVVLVDASASASACFDLFGRMRDVLWQQPHHWVLAIDDADRPTALRPPADAFFDTIVELASWPTDGLVQILKLRAEPTPPPPEELLASAATSARGNPRDAIRALNDALVHGHDPARLLDARGQLVDRAFALGRPAGMLMAELLDREMASPSDEHLQKTLGVSRARLNQLFRQLLDQELVEADSQSSVGPGRPRTIYRPALPA